MTDRQIAQKARLEKIKIEFNKSSDIVKTSPPLKRRTEKLEDLLTRIEIYQLMQGEGTEGETLEKASNKGLLIAQIIEVSASAYAWALDNGTEKDKEETYFVASDLNRLSADRLWEKAENAYKVFEPNKTKMEAEYMLAPSALADLKNLIDLFDKKKNSPEQAIQRRVLATSELATVFEEVIYWLNEDLIPFMRIFEKTEKEFYTSFLNAAKVQGE